MLIFGGGVGVGGGVGLPGAGDVLFLATGYTGMFDFVKMNDTMPLWFVSYTSISKLTLKGQQFKK